MVLIINIRFNLRLNHMQIRTQTCIKHKTNPRSNLIFNPISNPNSTPDISIFSLQNPIVFQVFISFVREHNAHQTHVSPSAEGSESFEALDIIELDRLALIPLNKQQKTFTDKRLLEISKLQSDLNTVS